MSLNKTEQKERERLHRLWATQRATRAQTQRCMELDRKADVAHPPTAIELLDMLHGVANDWSSCSHFNGCNPGGHHPQPDQAKKCGHCQVIDVLLRHGYRISNYEVVAPGARGY